MTYRSSAAPLIVVVAHLLLAAPSWAGGLYVSTFGTPSQATASAGANAIAQDASTAFHNAAGMTRLDDHQLLAGLAPGFTDVEFDPSLAPVGGDDGGEQGGFIPVTSNHYVHKLSDRWRFGLSLISISGAALDPRDTWAGRNEITKLSLFTLSLAPSLAVRVTDWLSLGVGAGVTYGKMDFHLRSPLPAMTEPFIKLKNLDDWTVAPVVSVLVEPTPELRFGVVYQGESELELDGKLALGGLSPSLELDLKLAQAVRTSVYWDASDCLSLMANAGWEDWSVTENIPVSFAAGGALIPLGFRDTWYLGGGIHYRPFEGWTLQTGVRYDSSALPDSVRTTAFPIDRVWTFGVGALHDYSENLRLGFNFAWVDLGDAPVSTGFVSGKYGSNDLYLFGLTLAWKKLPWSGKATLRGSAPQGEAGSPQRGTRRLAGPESSWRPGRRRTTIGGIRSLIGVS